MRRAILTALTVLILLGLLIPCQAQAEGIRLRLELEPSDCGTVYAEPPGENYTYAPGTMIQIYAKEAEGCRFAYWVSDLAGLNGSINNPVTLTLFSDAYFKAVFMRIGAPRPGEGEGVSEKPRTHVFLRIAANVTNFKEEVKLVPIGEEVLITVPRDIYVNDSARYVFVGWEGLDSKEPTLRMLITDDTTVTALYTLYLRFMDLWYHHSDFTVFHAPVVELGPGERLRPLHLLLKPMNITLPVGSKIPREFVDRLEVKYQKEYLLAIVNTAPEPIAISINGQPYTLGSYIERWIPEGMPVTLSLLTDETERIWITGPAYMSLVMDGPKSITIEYEEKPHAWVLDSPLRPILYPILDSIAERCRGTGMWPHVSRVISQPALVYSMLAAIPAGLGGAGYAGYRMLSRIGLEGLRLGRARRAIEERIRRARPEELISTIPPAAPTVSISREEERLPERIPFPEWLYVEVPEREEAEPTRAVEPIKAVEGPEEGVRRVRMDPMEIISMGGEVMADDLIEALTDRLDGEVFNALRDAILSGRLKIAAVRGMVWSPFGVRAVARVLEREGRAAIVGADAFVRRRVAEWLAIIEQEAGGSSIIIESAHEADVESAAARMGDASLVILGEAVGPEAVRLYSYAARLLGRRLVKLGEGPLPPVRLQHPSREELAAYMIVRAAIMGLMDRVGLEDALEVAEIAYMSRSYMTVDDYLAELAKGPVDMEAFKRIESGRLFDRFEQEAVAVWKRTGSVSEAIVHYSNILAQMDPANMDVRLRMFREKLAKMAERQRHQEPPRQAPAPSPAEGQQVAEAVGRPPAASREVDEVARRYEVVIRSIGNEEVKRRLAKHLESLRGGRDEEES